MLPTPRLAVGDVHVPRTARQSLARRLRRAGQAAGVPAPVWATLGVRIVGDVEMARLHVDFMGEPGPTDVMAFPGTAADSAHDTWVDQAPFDDDWNDEAGDDWNDEAGDDEDDDEGDEGDDDDDAEDDARLDDATPSSALAAWDDLEASAPASLGDIVIDWDQVRRQARDGSSAALVDEATILLVHGLCHLLGHDHRTRSEGRRMHRAEARLLRALHVPDVPRPYAPASASSDARAMISPRTTAGLPERAGRPR